MFCTLAGYPQICNSTWGLLLPWMALKGRGLLGRGAAETDPPHSISFFYTAMGVKITCTSHSAIVQTLKTSHGSQVQHLAFCQFLFLGTLAWHIFFQVTSTGPFVYFPSWPIPTQTIRSNKATHLFLLGNKADPKCHCWWQYFRSGSHLGWILLGNRNMQHFLEALNGTWILLTTAGSTWAGLTSTGSTSYV